MLPVGMQFQRLQSCHNPHIFLVNNMVNGSLSVLNSNRRINALRKMGLLKKSVKTREQSHQCYIRYSKRIEYMESCISDCYIKEARAILNNTKTRINRCVKLDGD